MLGEQNNSSPLRERLSLVLGFALGFFVGYIPLMWSLKDPFDELISNSFWFAGLYFVAIAITVFQPGKAWKCAVVVGLGFPAAVTADILMKPDSYQVPPLTNCFRSAYWNDSVFFRGLQWKVLPERKG